jgi:CRISPR-associated endonuclease/helicase Cas3
MRVLANQFADDADHRAAVPDLRVQTGERPESPDLSAPLVFATIDQVLSSFLLMPYGLSHRQANLNAGAILSSYLVLDEFHLFDPKTMLPRPLRCYACCVESLPFA